MSTDFQEAQLRGSEAGDDNMMVPLILQNKPPVMEGREDDELADIELRPEQVGKNYMYLLLSVDMNINTCVPPLSHNVECLLHVIVPGDFVAKNACTLLNTHTHTHTHTHSYSHY